MSKEMLFWVDIETTGLHPQIDHILEVAAFTAPFNDPFNLTPVVDTPVHWYGSLAALEDVVVKMHTANGLFKECARTTQPSSLEKIEKQILEKLEKDVTYYPAGSSVYFDLSFIRRDMPRLSKLLSHKHYDVSAVKLFARSQGMPEIPRGEPAHRARADVLESVEHAKQVRLWIKRG